MKDVLKTDNQRSKESKKTNGIILGLAIATGVLAATTVGFGVGYGITQNQAVQLKTSLENNYQKNLFELVDNVNNAETNLSKVLAANTSAYQGKMLMEVAKDASSMQANISSLPLSQEDINDNIKMVNQISGYTSTLAEKVGKGEALSQSEIDTLENVHQNLLQLKSDLNNFLRKVEKGYSIVENSMKLSAGSTNFSVDMRAMKSVDIEYPTMIYDGPFSDSIVNSPVKGLSGKKVSKDEASKIVAETFKDSVEVVLDNETNGRFETFNYRLKNSADEMLYVQVTKIGGHILTVSGAGKGDNSKTIDEASAEKLAIEFAKTNGIENPQVVWKDFIADEGYFNIAPTQSGVVLYPDLVKVKIDFSSGTVVGYDATTYFTNHTLRNIAKATGNVADAKVKIPNQYKIQGQRLVLAPLDFNREVLCYEFEATDGASKYYFYVNAVTGEEENILKVIETDNGNKLM